MAPGNTFAICSNKPTSTINQLKHCRSPRAILASRPSPSAIFFHIALVTVLELIFMGYYRRCTDIPIRTTDLLVLTIIELTDIRSTNQSDSRYLNTKNVCNQNKKVSAGRIIPEAQQSEWLTLTATLHWTSLNVEAKLCFINATLNMA